MKCRICGNESKNLNYRGRDQWFGNNELFDYTECGNCGCLQIDEYPINISDYYQNGEYYSFKSMETEVMGSIRSLMVKLRNRYALYGKGVLGRLLFSINPTNVFDMINSLDITSSSKMIDIGCGDGSYLRMLSGLGMNNLLGTDPFLDQPLEYENGLQILNKTIFEINDQFDIVSLKNSFEHMPNPILVLEKVKELLTVDGHAVIRIPIVSSYAWRHYKEDWVQFDAPRHFYIHTIQSMTYLIDKVGFNIVDVVYDSGIFQFLGSEQLRKGIPLFDERSWKVNPKESIFTKSDIKRYQEQAKQLNMEKQGDVAIFILKREHSS